MPATLTPPAADATADALFTFALAASDVADACETDAPILIHAGSAVQTCVQGLQLPFEGLSAAFQSMYAGRELPDEPACVATLQEWGALADGGPAEVELGQVSELLFACLGVTPDQATLDIIADAAGGE